MDKTSINAAQVWANEWWSADAMPIDASIIDKILHAFIVLARYHITTAEIKKPMFVARFIGSEIMLWCVRSQYMSIGANQSILWP